MIDEEKRMLSVCGIHCLTDCKAYKTECEGCNELTGKVSWAQFYGKTHCPIYECVEQKCIKSCNECGKAPCEIWHSTRNPEASDEEFDADIKSRLKNLRQ
jgi:hypothetical protein